VSDLWGLEPGVPPEGLGVPPRAWQSVSTQAWLALGGVGTPPPHCAAQEPITMLSTLMVLSVSIPWALEVGWRRSLLAPEEREDVPGKSTERNSSL